MSVTVLLPEPKVTVSLNLPIVKTLPLLSSADFSMREAETVVLFSRNAQSSVWCCAFTPVLQSRSVSENNKILVIIKEKI